MAVETIFLSLVVRRVALDALDAERAACAQWLLTWQPDWSRADEHLVATSFMSPAEMRRFGEALEFRTGLRRVEDWVVVDMMGGPLEPVPWLRWRGGPGERSGAWLGGTQPGPLAEVTTLLPGFQVRNLAVCQVFGADYPNDPEAKLPRAERDLPNWGGCDLWLVQDPRVEVRSGAMPTWCGYGADGVDFMTF